MRLVFIFITIFLIKLNCYANTGIVELINDIPNNDIDPSISKRLKEEVLTSGKSAVPILLEQSLNQDFSPQKQEVILRALESLINPKYSFRRVEECGVEEYREREDFMCGAEKYFLERSQFCGVERYNEGKDMSCPGSIKSHKQRLPYGPTCSVAHAYCRELLKKHGRNSETCHGIRIPCEYYSTTGGSSYYAPILSYPDMPAKCRGKRFGVELYKECRHRQHGAESYKKCRRPEFGVETYNECKIIKTHDEIDIHTATLEANIGLFGSLLLINKANVLRFSQADDALYCFIRKWEENMYADEVIEDLKLQFTAITGKVFSNETNISCANIQPVHIETLECSDEDNSTECRAHRAYNASLEYLKINYNRTLELVVDRVSRENITVRKKLISLIQQITGFVL